VSSFHARRAFAVLLVVACATVSLPSSAAVNLLGSIAAQPHAPARLATCSASVSGPVFSPTIAFAQQPDPVARYTVLLAFFDRRNISVGHVDVTDHGTDTYDLPPGADSMTCAISRLTLDDGSVFPASSAGNASAGGVVLGVLAAGALAGIAIGVSHKSSTTTAKPTATATPTPNPSASATATGATATPTATASATTVASPTATSSYGPTPSPFPTSPTTPAPTLRPHIVAPGRGR
jgi:hypothetical protein